MTKWQYATMLRDPDGELFDLYTSGNHDLESATAAAKEWNDEEGDSPDVCVVVRRTAPVAAGKWEEFTPANPEGNKE